MSGTGCMYRTYRDVRYRYRCFCVLLSKLYHVNARPPARNQGVETTSPRGFPSSNHVSIRTLESTSIPNWRCRTLNASHARLENKHIIDTEATNARTHSHLQTKRWANVTPIYHTLTQGVITSQCNKTDRPLSYVSDCARNRANDAPPW